MPSLTLPTSASTETLLLKCQKETHKPPLPPTWSSHPPNQEIHPPRDTLALAVRIDAAAPTSVRFYDSATNRPVGSVGPEFRGSLVLVPWRPGLKFVVAPTCRRRGGCLVGIIREGKGVPVGRCVEALGVVPGITPEGIPKVNSDMNLQVTANMKVKVTPKMGGNPKSYIPIAIPKKSPGPGKAEDGNQGGPPRHGTAIPSPIGNTGSRRRRHVSFDDKIVMGKRSIRMALADQ